MAETSAPRSRWWSFRLWQLFAVMTLLCLYLAWQVSIVRHRAALRKELASDFTYQFTSTRDWQTWYSGHEQPATIPLVRRWLDDEPIQTIGYYSHMLNNKEDLQRLGKAFPEAKLVENAPPLEPCHPGCFPHGTLVETPFGPQPIDAIAVGDEVWTISPQGRRISLPVLSIFRTRNRLWIVETSQGILRTTETQPLGTSLATTATAGELQPGDVLLRWSPGETDDGLLEKATVIRVYESEEIASVFNLVLGQREPFLADGFLARSKPPGAAE